MGNTIFALVHLQLFRSKRMIKSMLPFILSLGTSLTAGVSMSSVDRVINLQKSALIE